MNGQLSEQPVAEIIREIGTKSLSGSLRLQQDRIRVVTYFKDGVFVYAASNVRSLRLREYVLKSNLVPEHELARLDEKSSDIEFANSLSAKNLLTPSTVEQLHGKLVSDVLKLTLLWTEGTWEFDSRLQLSEQVNLKLDCQSLLVEAGRRIPMQFITGRFRNPLETLSPLATPPNTISLTPTEVFLFSRLDQPMALNEVTALSGVNESDALRVIYSLILGGLIQREHWKHAFRDLNAKPETKPEPKFQPAPVEERGSSTEDDVTVFLARLDDASSHYEVLDVAQNAAASDIKSSYYRLAKNFHPDRFRQAEASLQARIEAAFARVTQAYDTLRDAGPRATYDSKLSARAKVRNLADTAPKSTVATPTAPLPKVEDKGREAVVNPAHTAEVNFKEGFAALQMGQRNTAVGLLGSASRAFPNEARYRAFYGRALAGHESTRRLAETEYLAALKLDPRNAEYRTMLAELYRDLGFILRAKGEAERALASDANNKKARELLQTLK